MAPAPRYAFRMTRRRSVVAGGGAAGFFAAIACAEAAPGREVLVLERGPRFLAKVRVSGGGRCNVTHHCFEPREFATRYPRGGPELLGPFQRFQARDTVAWFAARGVGLKTEADGRMFPVTDSSQTVVDCLIESALRAGVMPRTNSGVEAVSRRADGRFDLTLAGGERLGCDQLLLATGGARTEAQGALAVALGHTLEPPVPSLFTFQVDSPLLAGLAGVSVAPVELTVPGAGLRERGPLLVTHKGLSGPAVLRLSAWGARWCAGVDYSFPLRVNWLPAFNPETLAREFLSRRRTQGARRVVNSPVPPLSTRLWERLVLASGASAEQRWASLGRSAQQRLVARLLATELPVAGKSLNRDEFVTCGGVRLREVNFKAMESRLCPGLFFAGEALDIDGVTGGFNFQAAWTTGWIAGRAMAAG